MMRGKKGEKKEHAPKETPGSSSNQPLPQEEIGLEPWWKPASDTDDGIEERDREEKKAVRPKADAATLASRKLLRARRATPSS